MKNKTKGNIIYLLFCLLLILSMILFFHIIHSLIYHILFQNEILTMILANAIAFSAPVIIIDLAIYKQIRKVTLDVAMKICLLAFHLFLMVTALLFLVKNNTGQIQQATDVISHNKMILIIVSGILAPIYEEVFFRGLLLNILKKESSESLRILVSSILFGLLHSQSMGRTWSDITIILLTSIIGFLLSMIYRKNNNLSESILLHSIFNLLGILI